MDDQASTSARLRVLLLIVLVFAALAAFLWWRVKRPGFQNDTIDFSRINKTAGSENSPSTSPALSPVPSIEVTSNSTTPTPSGSLNASSSPEETQAAKDSALKGNYIDTLTLIIPVVGVTSNQLRDTFTDSRAEGRVHDAIDIAAPAGTQVVAATDGEIVKLFQSDRGGTTIYQLSPDKKLVFYYAHLQRYADGLTAGKFVKQGEVIGYVGDTGNAGAGNYHLHFSIAVLADPKRYWEGSNINPYPLLHK
jgi:murein DD-endopeptidase MepM/ murein hydrolase activator NlpD